LKNFNFGLHYTFFKVASYFDDVFNQLDKKGVTEEIFYLIRKYPAYELWVCIILNFKTQLELISY